MEERRKIHRVDYPTKSVIVVCDTGQQYYVETENVSPLGMGLHLPGDCPNLVGKDIIIVAETLIMYADVTRQEKREDGSFEAGIKAKKFSAEVLEYLFHHIAGDEPVITKDKK